MIENKEKTYFSEFLSFLNKKYIIFEKNQEKKNFTGWFMRGRPWFSCQISFSFMFVSFFI